MSGFGVRRFHFLPSLSAPWFNQPAAAPVSEPVQAALATTASQIEQQPAQITAEVTPEPAPVATRVSAASRLITENAERQKYSDYKEPLRFSLDEDLRLHAGPLVSALGTTDLEAKKAALLAICRQRDDYLHTSLSVFARPHSTINKALVEGLIEAFAIKTRRELIALVAPSLTDYCELSEDAQVQQTEDTSECLELGPLALEGQGSSRYTDARKMHGLTWEQHQVAYVAWPPAFRDAIYKRTSVPEPFLRALSGARADSLKERLEALLIPLSQARKSHENSDLLAAALALSTFFEHLESELPDLLSAQPVQLKRFLSCKSFAGKDFEATCSDDFSNLCEKVLLDTPEHFLALRPEPFTGASLTEAELSGPQLLGDLPVRFIRACMNTYRNSHRVRLPEMTQARLDELFSDETFCSEMLEVGVHPPQIPALFSALWTRDKAALALEAYKQAYQHAPFCEGMMKANPEKLQSLDPAIVMTAVCPRIRSQEDKEAAIASLEFLLILADLSDSYKKGIAKFLMNPAIFFKAIDQDYLSTVLNVLASCGPIAADAWVNFLSSRATAGSSPTLHLAIRDTAPDTCQQLLSLIPTLLRPKLIELVDNGSGNNRLTPIYACASPNLELVVSWLAKQGLNQEEINDRLFLRYESQAIGITLALNCAPKETVVYLLSRLAKLDGESAFAILHCEPEPLIASCLGIESLHAYWDFLKQMPFNREQMAALLGFSTQNAEQRSWISTATFKKSDGSHIASLLQAYLRRFLIEAVQAKRLDRDLVRPVLAKQVGDPGRALYAIASYVTDLGEMGYLPKEILQHLSDHPNTAMSLGQFRDTLEQVGLSEAQVVLALPPSALHEALMYYRRHLAAKEVMQEYSSNFLRKLF